VYSGDINRSDGLQPAHIEDVDLKVAKILDLLALSFDSILPPSKNLQRVIARSFSNQRRHTLSPVTAHDSLGQRFAGDNLPDPLQDRIRVDFSSGC